MRGNMINCYFYFALRYVVPMLFLLFLLPDNQIYLLFQSAFYVNYASSVNQNR